MKKYKLGSKLENQKQKFESRTRGLLSYWIACTKRRSAEDNSLVGLIENRARHASILTPRTISATFHHKTLVKNSGDLVNRLSIPLFALPWCKFYSTISYHIFSRAVYPREGGEEGWVHRGRLNIFVLRRFPQIFAILFDAHGGENEFINRCAVFKNKKKFSLAVFVKRIESW